MSFHDWYSQEELIAELARGGVSLSERTLRFWVTNGVLAPPVKKPFRGADGRVGYFPKSAVAQVAKILRLQEEGWKLRQIKARLSQPEAPDRPSHATPSGTGKLPHPADLADASATAKLSHPAEASDAVKLSHLSESSKAADDGEQWAARYLQDLLSDTESRDRRRCFASSGAPSSELRQVRHYLVARLERWVGRSVAVRATSAFLLGLSRRDFQRLVSRLKLPSSVRLVQALADSEVEARPQFTLPDESCRSAILDTLDEQRERLLAWNQSPESPPVLWERTLACLESLQTLLEKSPWDESEVQACLALLHSLEMQAEEELTFLKERTEGATR